MNSKPPSFFHSCLTTERLTIIAEHILDMRFNTLREMDSVDDDAYTRGTTTFGRTRNSLIRLCNSKKYSWLTLVHSGMDVTCCIDGIPFRFFQDNPNNPKKEGFFKRNEADSLFPIDDTEPLIWRFVIEQALTEEDEDKVFFVGYNAYQEIVSQWSHDAPRAILHSIDKEVPLSKELSSANIEIRKDKGQAQSG